LWDEVAPGPSDPARERLLATRGETPADDRPAPDPLWCPAQINEDRGFAATITSEALPLDALQRIVELTRGLAPGPEHSSGLPHHREKRPD